MPKTNQGGATAAGMTGIVEHGAPLADGRTLSELDPERHLDGTLIEGEHPDRDEADFQEREAIPAPGSPNAEARPVDLGAHEDNDSDESIDADADTQKSADTDKERASSLGSSYKPSPTKTASTRGKNNAQNR